MATPATILILRKGVPQRTAYLRTRATSYSDAWRLTADGWGMMADAWRLAVDNSEFVCVKTRVVLTRESDVYYELSKYCTVHYRSVLWVTVHYRTLSYCTILYIGNRSDSLKKVEHCSIRIWCVNRQRQPSCVNRHASTVRVWYKRYNFIIPTFWAVMRQPSKYELALNSQICKWLFCRRFACRERP